MSETKPQKPCHHCEGKGYLELRDCTGKIQREETCSFCQGTGESVTIKKEAVSPFDQD
jgi:DnaJ-class molecular chaperone